ncbi:MAG: hypothetical protein OHK0045_00330 [Raineya sp.]
MISAFKAKENHKELNLINELNPNGEICFKVKNDTGSSVTLDTGSGRVPMNSGTKKEFCMGEGKKLSLVEGGKITRILLTVDVKMVDKTFKLSDLI